MYLDRPSMSDFGQYMRQPDSLFTYHQGEWVPRYLFNCARVLPEEANDNAGGEAA